LLSALIVLAATSGSVRAAEPTATPALVVRLAPLDELFADARFLVEVAGKEEEAKQIEGIIKAWTKNQNLEGIDTKKPIGLYGKLAPNPVESEVILLVPVADEKALLNYLTRAGVEVKQQQSGAYKFTAPDEKKTSGFFRFANGYAYVTVQDEKLLDKDRLLQPGAVFAAVPVGAVSIALNLDGVPQNLKELALTQIDLKIEELKEEKRPDETAAERKFRLAAVNEFGTLARQVIKEGGQVSLVLDVDRQAKDLSLSARFNAKPGTDLAKRIAAFGSGPSLAASLSSKDSAIFLGANVSMPESLKKEFGDLLDEGIAKVLKDQPDKDQRELVEQAYKALSPTLKAGVLDGGFGLRGPSPKGVYTVVIGARVQDGAALDKLLRQIVAKAPPAEQAKIKLDFDKVRGVGIHRITPDGLDADTKKLLGDGPFYLAVREDALFLTAGEDALPAIKDLITVSPQTGPALKFDMSFARSAQLMVKENKAAPDVAKKVFAKDPTGDRLTLTLEGGKELKLRLVGKATLIAFFLELEEAKKKGL
jgi:hypothetical protein